MVAKVVVEPMTEEFILWRCLHSGPLSQDTINQWDQESKMPWQRYRERNVSLLKKLTQTYGACAIIARDGERIVGQLRFYPRAVLDIRDFRYICLQQDPPPGPEDDLVNCDFPAVEDITDKTLAIQCMMTGSPQQEDNPYQRKGLGTRLVRTLIQWAREQGWERIEVDGFEDLPLVYQVTGSAGRTFWEKLGFSLVDRHPHPDLQGDDGFVKTLEKQAKAAGIDPKRARDRLVMRREVK